MENASNKRKIVNGAPADSLAPLSHNQKKALLVLAFFSLVVLIFGVWNIRHQIYSPFDYSRSLATTENAAATSTTANDYTTDTDKDGISDYEEINVYSTSPYLEDTDSDGFNDKDEILHGTDPNCASGQVCHEVLLSTSTPTSTVSNIQTTETTPTTGSSSLESMLEGGSDAASLRQLLLDNGMDKATLDQISDEDLMKSYLESINSNQ